jgi:hypothetical protein
MEAFVFGVVGYERRHDIVHHFGEAVLLCETIELDAVKYRATCGSMFGNVDGF